VSLKCLRRTSSIARRCAPSRSRRCGARCERATRGTTRKKPLG
jgi:hypothetical protein